jgi:lipopolysaccharide transport system ATP-binding protein
MPSKHVVTRLWRQPHVRRVRHQISPVHWFRTITASQRRLPNYLIIGTQKGGTTSLHGYLAQHPQVVASTIKEVHYFDKNHHRGADWYRTHFPLSRVAGKKLCGESSPFYMFCPNSPARAASLLPDAKIIVLLRNPVDRAYSHYQLTRRRKRESLSFEAAVAAEPERLTGERDRLLNDATYDSQPYRNFSYVSRGFYLKQLVEWWKYYPKRQFLILQSENFFRDTAKAFDRVLDFLHLDRWYPPQFANLYPGKYASRVQPAMRAKLSAMFAAPNEQLYAALGTRFDWQ